jgi:hypothetical protein
MIGGAFTGCSDQIRAFSLAMYICGKGPIMATQAGR